MRDRDGDERLLPLGAMALRLGIQAKDLRQAAEAGAVPCIRIGERGLLFDPEALLRVLEQRAREQAKAAGEES